MDRRAVLWATGAIVALAGLALVAVPSGEPSSTDAEAPAAATVEVTLVPRLGALTPSDPNRLPVAEQQALRALASPPGTPLPHGHGHGGVVAEPEVALSPGEQAVLDQQWAAAVAAAQGLLTPADATAAGYVPAAVWGGGVGTHYVKWSLVDRPFDPAHPSMLLYDDREGRPARLAGFSYWVASDGPPAGFAGPNDHWHQHNGLCIVNGWVDGQEIADANQCAGTWIAGDRLWMLHAWVAPSLPNRWGRFALLHPALCPPVRSTPDIERCPTAGDS